MLYIACLNVVIQMNTHEQHRHLAILKDIAGLNNEQLNYCHNNYLYKSDEISINPLIHFNVYFLKTELCMPTYINVTIFIFFKFYQNSTQLQIIISTSNITHITPNRSLERMLTHKSTLWTRRALWTHDEHPQQREHADHEWPLRTRTKPQY